MITIVNTLSKVLPAFNPIEIQFFSYEQSRTDFQYIVRIKTEFGDLLATKKLMGGANVNDAITVDVSRQLSALQKLGSWRHDVENNDYVYHVFNFCPGFSVDIVEYYDGAEHDTKTVTGYTLPASLSALRFPFYDYAGIATGGKWLTNLDKFTLRTMDKLTVGLFCPVTGVPNITYNFYNADGTILTTITKVNPLATVKEDVIFIHAGIAEIMAFTGVSQATLDSTQFYEIKPDNCPAMRVVIASQDSRFAGVVVHYLNEWGGVDSFLFNLAAQRSVNFTKKTAKLKFTGSQIRPASYGFSNTAYATQYSDTLKLTSDFISDNDARTLVELVTSPIITAEIDKSVFFPDTTGAKILVPVDSDATSYEVKQSIIDKLFNAELQLKISLTNTRQTL